MYALTLLIVGMSIAFIVNAVCIGAIPLGLAILIIPSISILGALTAPSIEPNKVKTRTRLVN